MHAARLWIWIILVAVALPVPGWGQQSQREPVKASVDLHGDPLPTGAIARLGTVRFRHLGAVHAVAFSEDGKLLAASSDGTNMVILWERATGRKVREIPVATRGIPPTQLRFSPDGKRLYASSWYDGVALHAWDVATGALPKDLTSPPAGARILGYSADGRQVILLNEKAEIINWDLDARKARDRYANADHYLGTAALHGERLLVPRFDQASIAIWDAAQKKELWSVKTTREKNYPGLPMAFSADGKLFAVETPAQVISVYESVTGKLVHKLEGDVNKIYYSLSISPDKQTLAASCWDGSVRLWDLQSGRQRAKIAAIQGWATHVFFSPDSKVFATGGGNNAHAVTLWETATAKPIETFAGHTSPVASLSFSPDGQTAATSSWLRGDPIVRLWDPKTGRLLRSFKTTDTGGVSEVAFSPDGRTLALCGWSGEKTVQIWDVAAGRARHELAGHEAGCTCVAFSPDGKRLASGDAYYNRMGEYEGRLCLWDAETGKRLREIRGTRGAIQRVLFTRDGRHVLAAADGVHVYDADTGNRVGAVFQAKSRIWHLALSGDGRLVATSDSRGPVRLWELATRREIPLKLPDAIGMGVALTSDGRILIASGPNGVVFFHWPSAETIDTLSRAADFGTGLALSPDGRRLATAGNAESSALIWDVAGMVNRPLPAVAEPDKAELGKWWVDLHDDDPGVGYRAVWRLASASEQALPYLAKMLRPVKGNEPAVVARLIDDLDSARFEVREQASRELERLGEAVVPALRKAHKGAASIEQARRMKALLDRLDDPLPAPEQQRAIRAVAALEQIGNPQARKLLVELAAGASGARVTQEATAALQRLK